jgi:hypothetical protein
LGILQGGMTTAMQQAGIVDVDDQGNKRVKSGALLGTPGGAGGSQGRQRDSNNVWETAPGLSSRACHTVVPLDPRAVRRLVWRVPVGKGRHPPGERRYAPRAGIKRRHGCGGGQQAQRPDRATVRVDATGYSEHLPFATSPKSGQLLAQPLAGRSAVGSRGKGGKRRPQRVGRAAQHAYIHIVVRAATAAVDQRWLGRELRLVDQGA